MLVVAVSHGLRWTVVDTDRKQVASCVSYVLTLARGLMVYRQDVVCVAAVSCSCVLQVEQLHRIIHTYVEVTSVGTMLACV